MCVLAVPAVLYRQKYYVTSIRTVVCMPSKQVDPNDVVVSEYNERQSFDPETLDELVDSVSQSGVVQPPLVTENEDGELAAYVGQRRVAAAQAAGLDEITVIVNPDISDEEALLASITENYELFSESVSPADRAQAIQTLWELMGGDGTPVFSHVAGRLGVPADTVRNWYEPMREEWEGTAIDPTEPGDPDESDSDFFTGENTLGERSLGDIRRMSEDSEEAESAATTAAAVGATQDDLSEASDVVESEGVPPDKAIEDVVSASEDDQTMKVNVEFRGQVTTDVQALADERGQTPETIIREAVEDYVESERQTDSAQATPMSDAL